MSLRFPRSAAVVDFLPIDSNPGMLDTGRQCPRVRQIDLEVNEPDEHDLTGNFCNPLEEHFLVQ